MVGSTFGVLVGIPLFGLERVRVRREGGNVFGSWIAVDHMFLDPGNWH